MKDKSKSIPVIFTIIFLVCVLAHCAINPPVDRAGTMSFLVQQGYTDIKITGYRWFSGSKSDYYCTGFEATATNGNRVTGTVTRGLFFKGKTIRFD